MAKEPAYIRELREYAKGELGTEHLPALEGELIGSSDRAAAVLYSTLTESSLLRLIRTKLRPDLTSVDRSELFETFERKIALAFALSLIGPKARSDLDLIRILRNAFAHSRRALEFATPQVAAVCVHLEYPDLPNAKMPIWRLDRTAEELLADEAETRKPEFRKVPRNRYAMACHTLAYRMLGVVQLPAESALKLFGDPAVP